jgi:hypothetical protein
LARLGENIRQAVVKELRPRIPGRKNQSTSHILRSTEPEDGPCYFGKYLALDSTEIEEVRELNFWLDVNLRCFKTFIFTSLGVNKTMRMLLVSCFILLPSFLSAVLANVEKTVFLGPPAITIPTPDPNLGDLHLIPISPLHPTVRTRLNASFPTNNATKGTETWVLLDGLTPGARYEVRICWLATVCIQPSITKFLS